MAESVLDGRIEAVRRFNRFYTRQIGVLDEVLLRTPFSLTEARVMYELAHRGRTTATELGEALALDAGYLSRILRGFQEDGRIHREPSATDARQSLLSLTDTGREAFAALDQATRGQIGALLGALPDAEQERLVRAMGTVERILARPGERPGYTLRTHRPGDMGWVVWSHGTLYWREYGWDERFEALVAGVVAQFVRDFDPRRERCWIAEVEGEPVGSVFLVNGGDGVGKLRLLLVDPAARGLGIGHGLVDECVRFARETGYRKVSLWTNDVLHTARRIYAQAGFRVTATETHDSFGMPLTAETWELEL